MSHLIFGAKTSSSDINNFKAFGLALETALATMFTKVAQSTDPDWISTPTSVPNPPTTGFIYRLNDSLQATHPIFIRFDLGNSGYGYLHIAITIGKGEDGAGNITSVIFPKTEVMGAPGQGTSIQNCYLSDCGGSGLCLSLSPAVNSPGYIVIERARDSAGNALGEGLMVVYHNQSNSGYRPVTNAYSYATTAVNSLPNGCFFIPFNLSANNSVAFGTTAPIFPGTVINPDGLLWVPRAILGAAVANMGLGQVVTSLLEGVDYMGLGLGSPYADCAKQQYSSAMIRWD